MNDTIWLIKFNCYVELIGHQFLASDDHFYAEIHYHLVMFSCITVEAVHMFPTREKFSGIIVVVLLMLVCIMASGFPCGPFY